MMTMVRKAPVSDLVSINLHRISQLDEEVETDDEKQTEDTMASDGNGNEASSNSSTSGKRLQLLDDFGIRLR